MPVDTVRAPRAWRLWRAWDAETVGNLSDIVSVSLSVRKRGAIAYATKGRAAVLFR
jgi:hypothetical protein